MIAGMASACSDGHPITDKPQSFVGAGHARDNIKNIQMRSPWYRRLDAFQLIVNYVNVSI
jgi:hypothetical protein